MKVLGLWPIWVMYWEVVKVWKWKSFSHVQLFVTPWTIQCMEFSSPEYWSGKPFPSPGDLPNPGIKSGPPALQADSLPAEPQGEVVKFYIYLRWFNNSFRQFNMNLKERRESCISPVASAWANWRTELFTNMGKMQEGKRVLKSGSVS